MKILVLGSGGREHAIVSALRRTTARPLELFCVPGNAGIAQDAQCLPISLDDHEKLADFANSQSIDLTFVGPEAPLAAGIVDQFERRGLRIVGPSAAAAKLEASKVAAKDFMARHQIPTARYRVASNASDSLTILRSGELSTTTERVVIKADGLAAGKGVVVASSLREAEHAVDYLMSGNAISALAASSVVIEEALSGTEISVLLFADGTDYKVMPPARDHKRIGENDTGPNTGGMGAITDNSLLEPALLEQIEREVIIPTLRGAESEGFPFRGVLFVGLMLTDAGPKVLEYNVRFGDPETQAILVRLQSDLAQIFEAMANRTLGKTDVRWSDESSACVVLASSGYPGKYESGFAIHGLDVATRLPNVQVFHAGTSRDAAGNFLTAGGRVLGVTATGSDLAAALQTCYEAIANIEWPGMQYRRDIGRLRAVSGVQ